ncbi:MAG: class I SAM-dependent methyltransferase [Candidatus Rokubacteria bacterium]|nr:class I SAM-dependent methyltransferase [Candidatus Rokubacteria bacterium]
MSELEPPGSYRPQFHLRWRWLARALDRFPRLKSRLAGFLRGALEKVFAPAMVTTERVTEYPFVFQNLDGVGGPVLDVGCCSSRLPIALASRGFRVIGIDVTPYPYRHPNLRAVCGDAMHLPFATGSFGAVLTVSVTEHIGLGHYGDPTAEHGDQAAVGEIARVLRPGGRAIITVPFGRAMTDQYLRVYDAPRLRGLLVPLARLRVEYARSRDGLWMPCTEAEAASVDWAGPARAVALIVAATRPR